MNTQIMCTVRVSNANHPDGYVFFEKLLDMPGSCTLIEVVRAVKGYVRDMDMVCDDPALSFTVIRMNFKDLITDLEGDLV